MGSGSIIPDPIAALGDQEPDIGSFEIKPQSKLPETIHPYQNEEPILSQYMKFSKEENEQ